VLLIEKNREQIDYILVTLYSDLYLSIYKHFINISKNGFTTSNVATHI